MSTVRRRWLVGAACLAAGVLAACSSARDDWNKASAQNTVAAYQAFLKQHPNTDLAVQARDRIQALQDERAWGDAQKTNTVAAFQQYLHDQPNGVHAAESRDRVNTLQRADAWKAAQAEGTTTALQAFLQQYSQGSEADQAHAKLKQLEDAESACQARKKKHQHCEAAKG